MDQRNFQTQFAQEYRDADDFEKVGLLKKKSERQNAVEIIFNLILSKLSEEVKQLVEADTEHVKMRDDISSRGQFQLLVVIRKVVSSGLTSDVTYQTMVNVRALHEDKLIFVSSFKSRLFYIKYNQTVFEPFSKACLV